MAETPDEAVPTAVDRKPGPRSLQLIWIVPIVAAVIGGWLALKAVWDRGPTVTIQFASGEGIEAGKTRIKHKAVDVGIVRAVGLSQDHKSVIVHAELDRQIADSFLVEDTRFWVVRPRIAGGQVSGLGTLLAGSYIGSDPGKAQAEKRAFVGLETPPPVTSDQAGSTFMLRADDLGSLDIGSPVYYRGVTAGRVVSTDLPADGKNVMVGVFVQSPYEKFVNHETRFWNASGVDLSLDASGVKLQTQSLVSLLLGGIAFETPAEAEGAPLAGANAQFRLWSGRAEAMRPRESVVEIFRLVFDHSVRGLTVGSTVDFRGLAVGEVRAINLRHDSEKLTFHTEVEIHLWPGRMRADPKESTARRMQRFVAKGFRAQLRSANLLTGQLYVALDFFPKAPAATYDARKVPPEIPTIAGSLAELQESIGNIVKSLEKVPFDRLVADARAALKSLDTTLKRADALMGQLSTEVAPELRSTLEQARKTLSSAQQVLATDSPVQGDLRETLQEVTKAAETVRALADYLERHPESLIRGKRPGDTK
jgi:paraquat-inducible protein B